jgi:hypothetical protein
MTKNCEKNLLLETSLYFMIKNYKGRPSYKKSIQPIKRTHPALQNMKIPNIFHFFVLSFFPSWLRIRIGILIVDPGPDPGTDPDPQL